MPHRVSIIAVPDKLTKEHRKDSSKFFSWRTVYLIVSFYRSNRCFLKEHFVQCMSNRWSESKEEVCGFRDSHCRSWLWKISISSATGDYSSIMGNQYRQFQCSDDSSLCRMRFANDILSEGCAKRHHIHRFVL